MFKKIYVLILISCTILTHAQDRNMYAHFSDKTSPTNGIIVPFPRFMFDYMQTLITMQEDFPDTILGTQKDPFYLALDILSIEDFKKTISIIKEARKFIYAPGKKITNEKLAHRLWEFVSTKKEPYTWLAAALNTGTYLGLKPEIMNALKLCIEQTPPDKTINTESGENRPETVDYAINGGLKNINTVVDDILMLIKENIILTTQSSLEFFFTGIFNNSKTKHSKNSYLLNPSFSPNNFSYSKMLTFHNAEARMDNENFNIRHFLFEDIPGKQTDILMKDNWIVEIPRYNKLGACPFQDLVSEVVKAQLNVNTTNSAFIGDYLTIQSGQGYTCYSNRYRHASGLLIGTSHIALMKEEGWISIPNVVQYIDIYTNPKGSRYLLCCIGFGGEKQKLVSFDLESQDYNILDEIENGYYATAQCIAESFYIYSRHNNTTNDSLISIIKLHEENTPKISIEHPLLKNGLVKQLIAYTAQDGTIDVSAIVQKGNTDYLCSISIDTKNKKIDAKEFPLPHQNFKLVKTTSLPSHVVRIDLTHPDIKDFVNHTEFYDEGSLYIGGFDRTMQKFAAVKYVDHSMLDIMQAINRFMNYGIEHLYMLSAITTRVINNLFTGMTPAEKTIFDTLKDEDKKTLLTIISWQNADALYQQPTRELNTASKDIPIVNSQTPPKKD